MVHLQVELRNEAVCGFFEAFEDDGDVFRRALDPDIEWCPIEEDRRPLHGAEAALRNRDAWLETWVDHRVDVEEVVEDGDDVVTLIHITGRGSGSGIEVDMRFYAQFRARDGRVAYIFDHEDREEALAAAGLSGGG